MATINKQRQTNSAMGIQGDVGHRCAYHLIHLREEVRGLLKMILYLYF